MNRLQHAVWPKDLPYNVEPNSLLLSETLFETARKHPKKEAIIFYGTCITYKEMAENVESIAGWLQSEAGIKKGDRVVIYAQNCPQFLFAFFGILRAGGVVVPVNPMYLEDELEHILEDAEVRVIFAAQELTSRLSGAIDSKQLSHAVSICYSDYLPKKEQVTMPKLVQEPRMALMSGGTCWDDVINCSEIALADSRAKDDLVLLPYTSGSTGKAKGCMHNSATVLHSARAIYDWFGIKESDVILSASPMFHVVGMQAGMIVPIMVGATSVILTRWDRETAAQLIEKFKVNVWPTVPTAVIDFINLPTLKNYDISVLRCIFGGGIAMPEAVAKKLFDLTGLTFLEGYGMTETIAPTTANPPQAPIRQCGGVPVLNTDVIIVDPETLEPMPIGEVGEILISGPQVMMGYWKNSEADAETFVEINSQRFLRSGDLGYSNDLGYIFIVDRIKRMINASGYKVWPTEVESLLYHHPDIEEACVISSTDEYRGETVKALVVLRDGAKVESKDITKWSHDHMAAYKVPRIVEFVESLPKSGTGKVLWRELQENDLKSKSL